MRPSLNTWRMILAGLMSIATTSHAQLLPKGTAALSYGVRQYHDGTNYYDERGIERTLGSKFNADFNSKEMASGSLGEDLKNLYDTVRSLDAAFGGDGTAPRDMNLGSVKGRVSTKSKVQYFGLGYGLTNRWMIYGAIPFVDVSVKTDLTYEDSNSSSSKAPAIASMPIKIIQSKINRDRSLPVKMMRSFITETKGYKPFDSWSDSGIGDVMIGSRHNLYTGRSAAGQYNLQLSTELEAPTGHQDDPDYLTDATISKGYYASTTVLRQAMTFKVARISLDTGLGLGLPTERHMRVPLADERLIDQDRKSKTRWSPGMDTLLAATIGTNFSSLNAAYSAGLNRHFKDQYAGDIPGNYRRLETESATMQSFHELQLNLSSVDAYLSGTFALPMIVSLTGHQSLSGRGASKLNYVDLALSSFLRASTQGKKSR